MGLYTPYWRGLCYTRLVRPSRVWGASYVTGGRDGEDIVEGTVCHGCHQDMSRRRGTYKECIYPKIYRDKGGPERRVGGSVLHGHPVRRSVTLSANHRPLHLGSRTLSPDCKSLLSGGQTLSANHRSCIYRSFHSGGQTLSADGGCTRRSGPPWNVVFFGTDDFALESLKILHRYRFDVGPVVMQKTFPVPPMCTSKELEAVLSKHGAEMLLSVLKNLPHCLSFTKEQPKEGVTFAPKISAALSCVRWEEQTPEEILRLERAVGFAIQLQAAWMGTPIKLISFTEVPGPLIRSDFPRLPGAIRYLPGPEMLAVRCKDGWVGVRTVKLKRKLSAKDFYNGYLHPWFTQNSSLPMEECRFSTLYVPEKPKTKAKQKPVTVRNM
ncbi:methionyl-tRNA formyltransferase, mitochondrial isoform X3 [Rana temporaria]|uniref:methionyl-tRNA formyltransferase, mitochondrial isoform X3 n=1 Tax=Rana temporaria TaxID=8407 RepID=UPI001AAC9D4A|nr:methionyl-tRNA formyltransferase, mitochondrial isoform X3 [Rana temporaria]